MRKVKAVRQGRWIAVAGLATGAILVVALFLLKPERKVAAPPSPGPAPGVKDRAPSTSPATANRVTASADRAEEKRLPSAPPPTTSTVTAPAGHTEKKEPTSAPPATASTATVSAGHAEKKEPTSAPPATASTATVSGDHAEEKKPTFARPEEVGEDFSLLESSEVVRRLTQSVERVVQRKAAKVLGDRGLAGNLALSQSEQQSLDGYIEKQIGLTAAEVGEDRVEANNQIRRLWRLAADKLIGRLGSENRTVVEAATKNLALMRDDDVVGKIIGRIKADDDVTFRKNAILALGMMREKRDCLVPDRHTLGDKESEALAQKVIAPFLAKLLKSEKAPETLQSVKMALQFLKNPPDARLRPSSGQ